MNRALAGIFGAAVLASGVAYFATSGAPQSVQSATGLICDVTIKSPVKDRLNSTTVRSGDSLSVTVSGTATRCPSSTVTITRSENGAAETAVGTPSTNGAGAWSQALTLTNGVDTTVFARMTTGGRTTVSSIVFRANTNLPKVAVASPVPDDLGVLRVVAAREQTCATSGGNIHVTAGEKGWYPDADCTTAGGQVDVSATVTGANGGTVAITYDGATVFSSAITSTPQTFTPTITLPDFTRGDLVFSATNGSGTTSVTYLTRALVSSPPTPTGPDGGNIVFRIANQRIARVEMDYVLPVIPAGVESASVELQWSTQTAIGPNFTVQNADGGIPFGNTCSGGFCWLSALAPGGWARTYDGGSVQLDAGFFDLGIIVFGRNDQSPSSHVRGGAGLGSHTMGLIQQIPDDCVLYDPSEVPQVWECKGGVRIPSGGVRTAVYNGLPPLNTYWLWPSVIY